MEVASVNYWISCQAVLITLIRTGDKTAARLVWKKRSFWMQIISVALAVSIALASSMALAQSTQNVTGEAIGHPPPIPGPPAIAEPSPAAKPQTAAQPPEANQPAPKGYTGAYAPAGTPATPYSTGPLPEPTLGPGLNTVAPDGVSTKAVKAVPCGTTARETDGFTTCVGISDESRRGRSRR
jgi:hypothetical protein